MAKLKLGRIAPDFALPDKNGKMYRLSTLKAKAFVVYFYPRDNTPGCTLEAKGFSKLLSHFKRKGVKVIGISGGDMNSKRGFCAKHKLKVLLLSDTNFSVSKAYGAYGTKVFMGRKFEGIKRFTFVLNQDREISSIFTKVIPADHAQEVVKLF